MPVVRTGRRIARIGRWAYSQLHLGNLRGQPLVPHSPPGSKYRTSHSTCAVLAPDIAEDMRVTPAHSAALRA
eukprot:1253744-Rhodomonas_salina.4